MIKIGEFSKLAQVPVATLRYYDQVGLLKPSNVDSFTGYRYYAISQLAALNRILALKGLGFSLEQIAELLAEELTPEQMRGMLRLRHAQINQQLANMQDQLLEVEGRLQQIEREQELSPYDVVLKQVEPQLVASVRAILPDHSAVGTLYREVYEALGEHVGAALGPTPGQGGQTLVLWYDNEFKETNVDGAAAFFVRCTAPDNGRMRVHELPAAIMATTIHHGPYSRINEAHEAVITWIDANNYRIVGADREINLYNRTPIRLDDPTYITEIKYPIEKNKEK
jgi:DNA-binding transcriptional MerR regulator/predicted transcriptional regulator YdeE